MATKNKSRGTKLTRLCGIKQCHRVAWSGLASLCVCFSWAVQGEQMESLQEGESGFCS